jgi:hypothetical protein
MPTPTPGGPVARAPFAPMLPKGHLAENVLHFVRVLRAAGIPVGPAKVIDALAAVEAVGLENRTDFREALAAVLCSRREHLDLYEQAFDLFWRDPRLLEKMAAAMLPQVQGKTGEEHAPPDVPSRLAEAMAPPPKDAPARDGDDELTLDAAFTFSPREVLQTHDFATMTAVELAQVKRMIAKLRLPLPEVPMRRTRRDDRGRRVDLRATMRRMSGAAGPAAPLAFRARTRATPPLVVLCDISGSMDRYTRMMLHFLHAITNDRHRVHVLLFGTRLTNVTRHLKHRDVDVALARVAASVEDWAGGTRIGASLAEFNRHWSRRLLGQNAVVLLISDGLDAEAGAGLDAEMERLAKSCRRLVWLNPLLRYADFEARPAGIRAMLPWVDDFLPVHNLASLEALAATLTHGEPQAGARGSGAMPGRQQGRRAAGRRQGPADGAGPGDVSRPGRT